MRSPWVASLLASLLSLPPAAAFAQAQPAASPGPAPAAGAAAPQAGTSPPAPDQDAAAKKKLEEEIAKELGATPPAAAGASQAQPAPATTQGASGGPSMSALARVLLLPDISAIGSFDAAYDSYDVQGRSPREGLFGPKDKPAFQFEELELGIQSVVDPYARADVFISFHPGGVDVEEAYLTTLDLPAGLQIKAGKFFSPFGRQNQQHPHIWDFVDAPLARDRLLASDVLSGPGVDVAWLAPLPWYTELQVAGQNTAPDGGDQIERLTGLARLLQYFPLGEATTVGVGLSAARRSEATGAFRDMGAVDVYFRLRPLATRAYVALQAELYTRKFRNVEGQSGTGGYAQLLYRHDAYWGYGIRYDRAPAAGVAAPGSEDRFGAVGIWYPSEFQRIRLQASYDRAPDGRDGLEALLALEFAIGAHGAHPF